MVEICTGAGKCFPEDWNAAARPCDSCNAAAASLFCRKHTAFLCLACDVGHVGDERVWICDVCEQSPASVTCKADAAALCVTCDGDIHSVNPLARRHERVPVVPIYGSAEVVIKSTAGNLLDPIFGYGGTELKENQNIISWGFPTDTTNTNVKFPSGASPADLKSIDLFPDVDHFFDFGFSIPTDARIQSNFHDSVTDSVVPVQTTVPPAKIFPPAQIVDHQQSPVTRYEIDFTRSAINSYNKNSTQSISHSVSSSSIDTGIVPDQGNSMSDTTYPFNLPVTGGVTGGQKAASLSAMDREARVLRYREKRKNRRFEKKIRYAARKAYAETRPRVKGRFAKRTESTAELDVERWLFTAESCGDLEYGVVPSF